jgi:hypothetical protein
MKVIIEFELDKGDMNADAIHDLIADWTFDMRVSRRLVSGTWKIKYDAR